MLFIARFDSAFHNFAAGSLHESTPRKCYDFLHENARDFYILTGLTNVIISI